MKVLHIVSDTNIGGAGIYIKTYLQAKSANIDAKVVMPRDSLLKPEIEKIGVEAIEADGISDKSFSFSGVSELKKIIKFEEPDVVHTHGCLSARIAARLAKTPKIVFTKHTAVMPSKFWDSALGKIINRMLNDWLENDIIAVSYASVKDLTRTGVPRRLIEMQYNGYEPARNFSTDEKREFLKKHNIEGNKPIISIIARLVSLKGHKYFIDVAKMFPPSVQFVIAGVGPIEQELKEYAEGASNIKFIGFLNDTGIFHSVSAIQTNFSSTETSNLALIEGMSYGVPAVVSDAGGNPELVQDGENGFICHRENIHAFYNNIKELLQNSELYDKISANAKEVFEKRFTAKEFAKNIERVYNEGVLK
ncbi:glycosyltransferase family 4 protein [Treponema sp. R6D11]